jgi:hypothetical protein
MKLLVATALLLVAALPEAAPPPPAEPPSDYTTQSMEPALVPEYDPADAPPPPDAMASPPASDARGGMRQCVGPDGVPIFTDRRCDEMGASDYVPPPASAAGDAPVQTLRVRSCARNQHDLLAGVRAALESHDANRLADYYHWTGMGSTEGYRLMERLDAFASRPVMDVQLVRAAPPRDEWELQVPPLAAEPFFRDEGDPGLDAADPWAAPAPARAPRPPRPRPLASMLRVDQMRSEQDMASTITYFHLLTNAGCWWMRF